MHRWYDHLEGERETKTDDVYMCSLSYAASTLSWTETHFSDQTYTMTLSESCLLSQQFCRQYIKTDEWPSG